MNLNNVDFAIHMLKVVTHENLWYSIDEVMKWLYRNYPEDMAYLEKVAKTKRDTSFDKFGSARDEKGKKQGDMRDLGVMPSIFSEIIAKFFGDPLQDKGNKKKFYRAFFKKYPKLCSIQKI